MSLLVLADDDGIRPAGDPDACFYCRHRVGDLHAPECVTIVRDAIYAVWMIDKKGGERVRRIGTYTVPRPASWDAYDCDFHANGSSWCIDNMKTEGAYVGSPLPRTPVGCLCTKLELVLEDRAGEIRRSA